MATTTEYRDHDSYREPTPPRGGYRYAPPRDALTGEPIRPDTVKRRVQPDERADNPPTRAQRAVGWQADLTVRPLRLHTAQVETAADAGDTRRGALGGHAYSRDMAHYLESGLRAQRSDERAQAFVWHRSAYGRGRVHAAFVAKFGAERGRLAYLAALAYATGDIDADTIMTETGHSASWVARMADLARTFSQPPPRNHRNASHNDPYEAS